MFGRYVHVTNLKMAVIGAKNWLISKVCHQISYCMVCITCMFGMAVDIFSVVILARFELLVFGNGCPYG